jgi:predicted GNAT family N-acyltransferase
MFYSEEGVTEMNLLEVMQIAQTRQEKEAIYAFRYQVYIAEMGKPYANADHERRQLYDELDELSLLLYVTVGAELAGTLRLSWGAHPRVAAAYQELFAWRLFERYPSNSLSVTSRLAVATQWRRTRVTPLLFQTAYELSAAKGDKFNFIHCTPRVTPIMRRYGFRQFLPSFHDPNAGEQIPMVLAMADAEHFQAIRSPFLPQARKWFSDPETGEWLRTHLLLSLTAASSATFQTQPA